MLDVAQMRGTLLRAWYGAPGYEWTSERGTIVTDLVRHMLDKGQFLQANNVNFGDPAPWTRKVLALEVQEGCWVVKMDNTNQIFHVPENKWAQTPDEVPFPRGIQVVQSLHGCQGIEQRRGTVVSIEGGLVGVDFADGGERQLAEVSTLQVVRDDTMQNQK